MTDATPTTDLPHEQADSSGVSVALVDDRHPVEVLADEFSLRCRTGESPSITEFELRAPEHREMIRTLFSTIAILERMVSQRHSERGASRNAIIGPKILGDFQIIREIGRGGMGIVYEAIQRSLARRVALKVLSSGISDSPLQLQRFRREAESAARLHHTNIVPVYGIGEEDGAHFYAMQFIDGIPLADAIKTVRHRSSVSQRTSQNGPMPSPSTHETGISRDSNLQSVSQGLSNSAIDDPTILMTECPKAGGINQVIDPSAELADESVKRFEDPTPSESTNSSPGDSGDHSHAAENSMQSTSDNDPVDVCFGLFTNNDSSEYFLRIAKLAAQVADALDYAHEHGVLHRDIKPSNLMLDRSGDVWIMDFGLVKILEQKDLTLAGEIVGTLRYMAPEQLQGRADVTTDVYGLGLTLYELLTLKPAFDGDETFTFAQRLHQSDIPRPRTINPAIPKDLETIVLKATANEPFARYATAADLAEDLRRFFEDRPILARRTSYPERLWRWSRRNPALAAATGSAIFLIGLVAIVATVGWLTVNSALREAKTAQSHTEKNLDLAMTAFDSILQNVNARGLPRSLAFDIPESEVGLMQSALSNADAQLLDRLLSFYRTFASQSTDNVRFRAKTADAYHQAGTILVRLGRLTEAEDDFQKAIGLLLSIPESDPHRTDVVVNTASLYNDLGKLYLRRGEFHPTLEMHLEAITLLLKQSEAMRAAPSLRFELARAKDLFASIDVRSGTDSGPGAPPSNGPGGPHPHFDHDRLAHETPPPGSPDSKHPHGPHGPPPGPGGPGSGGGPPKDLRERLKNTPLDALFSEETPSEGLAKILLDTSNDFRSLTNEFPDNAEYQFRLAQCLRHRLVQAASSEKPQVARETFLEATQILDRLMTKYPSDPQYHFELANTLTQASRAQSELDAKQSLDRAVELAKELADRFPTVSEYQLLLGTALARLAANQATMGTPFIAEESLEKSIAILEQLAKDFPDQGVIEIPLAKTCQQLGDLRRMTADDLDFPEPRLEQSQEILQKAIDRFERYRSTPQRWGSFNALTLSSLYSSLAETLVRLHQPEQAEKARRNASN